MSLTTQAVVNVKALQKSLNQMSRDERIEFIRQNGDPKVAVRVTVARRRSTRRAGAALADRREPAEGTHQVVRVPHLVGRRHCDRRQGEDARTSTSSARRASRSSRRSSPPPALTITKFTLSSWTVKASTARPARRSTSTTRCPRRPAAGRARKRRSPRSAARSPTSSRATSSCSTSRRPGRESRCGSRVSRRASPTRRSRASWSACRRYSTRRARDRRRSQLRHGALGHRVGPGLVAAGVLKPLNAKLGQACFSSARARATEVSVRFDKACAEAAMRRSGSRRTRRRSLYGAPPGAAQVGGEEPRDAEEVDDLISRHGARARRAPGQRGSPPMRRSS